MICAAWTRTRHLRFLLLPDRAVALLERMPGLGHTADEVAAARAGWASAEALLPDGFDDYLHLQ